MKKVIILMLLILSFNLYSKETNIAVVPFAKSTGVYQSITDSIQYKVEHFLVKNGASLVSRNKIKQILEEQKLSLNGMMENSKAVEIGNLLSAEKLVTGYLEKKGKKYFIIAQLIDVKSGKIENSVYTETSTNDIFFTESIKALVNELVVIKKEKTTEPTVQKTSLISSKTEAPISTIKAKIDENNEITINKTNIKVNKISFDYLDKDRFVGQYYVVFKNGDTAFIKGEVYIGDEAFDIYKKERDVYPTVTDDIVQILPIENSVTLVTGEKSRIQQELSDICVKNGNEKYLLGDAVMIAYANRIDDLDSFYKKYNIKKNADNQEYEKNDLVGYIYSLKTKTVTPKTTKVELPDNIKIEASNFKGEISTKDIEYILPANYKIKLKNGYIIRYFEPEIAAINVNTENQEDFDIYCAKENVEFCKEEFVKSLKLRLPENPNFIETIQDINLKKALDYYKNKRWQLLRQTTLYLDNRNITDVTDLQGLTSVETLYLRGNNIVDITPLSNMINLKDLSLGGNKISDFKALVNLRRLNSLDISNNQILDVEGIENIWWLKDLNISQNRIFDISPLENLKELKYLVMGRTRVEDMTPISKTITLERIDLSGNQLFYNLAPLIKLENLKSLSMAETSIQDISLVSNLTNLEKINIAYTKVTDIEPLKTLKFLNWLNLNGTKTNSPSFKNWKFNGNIDISNSKISGISNIKRDDKGNFGLKDGVVVYSYE